MIKFGIQNNIVYKIYKFHKFIIRGKILAMQFKNSFLSNVEKLN